ncbi:hypothetical protein BGW41_007425, partial [Actinomortierella wolfii]
MTIYANIRQILCVKIMYIPRFEFVSQRINELKPTSSETIKLPGFNFRPYGDAFEHLGVMLRVGGRNMKQIENEMISALQHTVRGFRLRHLSLQGRIHAANAYVFSKIWYVAPFYQFSASFFQRIDTLTTELLWDNRKAAISKDWLRQPKSAGGFGLLDVRHQCAALKAKWIARWNVAKPQWRDLFSAVTQSTYGLSSISEAIALLSLPTVRQTRNPHTRRGNSLTAVPHALWAFAQLDPVDKPPTLPPSTPPESSTAFADDIPLSRFSVGDARRYLDDKLFLKRQEKFEAG